MKPIYELRADFLSANAHVVSFDGEECLNRPYRFSVLFRVPLEEGLALDIDGAAGTTARFVIHRESTDEALVYSGTVAGLDLVEDLERFSLLRLHLVPKLWRLGLGEHSRVFVDLPLPDILTRTLEAGGLTAADYELRLAGKYPALAHVCQLRESRLAFITRWLERAGAYYFFEQGEGQEKLVITDSKASHSVCQDRPVRFSQHASDVARQEALRTFRFRHEVLPRRVTVTDYSPLNPVLQVAGTADVMPGGAGGDIHLFKINEKLPDGARRHAGVQALQHLARRCVHRAEGRVFGLMPGFTFELIGHPRDELEQEYLVTEVRHRGSAMAAVAGASGARDEADHREEYHCEVTVALAAEHWLPLAVTPWPRIAGTVRGRVDGQADLDFAQLDAHGQYLVRLMLDESDAPDGAASTRIRMMQPHAGNPEGMHFPLRKGTEVQVAFLRGDPDQPVIAGVVPNATTPSPVTRANRTQNVLQTGGLNRLEIEDTKGSEYVDLSTPPEKTFLHLGAHAGLGTHNYVLSTSGDSSMHTGGNRDILVGGDQTEKVQGNVREAYHSTQTTTVDASLTETIDGGFTQTIHAGSTQTIDGGSTQTIDGGVTRTVTGGQKETLDGGRTQTITGSSKETVQGDVTQTITGGASITSPAGMNVVATGGFALSTPASITLIANGGFNLLAPGGQTRLDDDWTGVGGRLEFHAPNQQVTARIRLDARLLYLEFIGAKIDAYGLKWTVGGTSKQGALVSINTSSVRLLTKALSKYVSAIKAWGS
ncbi:type VI secretion system tip protein TssI/VgrG [Sorangium sp. So ce429]